MHVPPLECFAAIFLVGGLSGLAALLNSNKPITPRRVSGTFFVAGFSGMGAALVAVQQVTGMEHGWYIAAGMAIAGGLGGGKVVDHFKGLEK